MKVGLNALLWVVMLNLCAAVAGQSASGASGSTGAAGSTGGQGDSLGTLVPCFSPEQRELTYQRSLIRGFMMIVARDEDEQTHPTPNRNPSLVVHQNYSKVMGISEGEEKVLRIIFYEAWKRDLEIRRESTKIALERGTHEYMIAHPDWMEESKKESSRVEDEYNRIYDGVIRDLKTQFGEDDYKKVNSYLERTSGPRLTGAAIGLCRSTGGGQPPTVPVSSGTLRAVQP